MLTEIDKRLFVESAIKAMAAYTLPYVTQVIGVIDDKTGEFRGTGFFCFVQGFPQRFRRFTTLGGNASFSESLAYGAMVRYREKDIAAEEREQFDQDLPAYKFLDDNFLEPHQFAFNFWVEPDHFDDSQSRPSAIKDWSDVFERRAKPPGSEDAWGLRPQWKSRLADRGLGQEFERVES
jgi:hypothetical protein